MNSSVTKRSWLNLGDCSQVDKVCSFFAY